MPSLCVMNRDETIAVKNGRGDIELRLEKMGIDQLLKDWQSKIKVIEKKEEAKPGLTPKGKKGESGPSRKANKDGKKPAPGKAMRQASKSKGIDKKGKKKSPAVEKKKAEKKPLPKKKNVDKGAKK